MTHLARIVRGVQTVNLLNDSVIYGQRACYATTAGGQVRKTALYDLHVAKGGKMSEFAGFSMPIQYSDVSITASHLHTRQKVSVFDVSHMLQTKIHGAHRVEFMESLVVGDVASLGADRGMLTLFTNEDGGIIDDLIVTNTSLGYLHVVSNAGCAEKDFLHMKMHADKFVKKGKDVSMEPIHKSLIAVQGPLMSDALQPHVDVNLRDLPFMASHVAHVFDVPDCRVTRCGYTGEDGVEISIPSEKASHIVERLLQDPRVWLAGLGARDSLRLEAGLCLYGSDIDDKTSPIEASLAWTISKRRRQQASFPGAKIILDQLKNQPKKKRVGFLSSGRPARGGTAILDETGSQQVGMVTSGCPSPSLKQNVAMGYVNTTHANIGARLKFDMKKQLIDCELVKMPFVPTKYYVLKKS